MAKRYTIQVLTKSEAETKELLDAVSRTTKAVKTMQSVAILSMGGGIPNGLEKTFIADCQTILTTIQEIFDRLDKVEIPETSKLEISKKMTHCRSTIKSVSALTVLPRLIR